eukprot:765656-Hanusia_phi.AAC.2
MLTLFLSPLLSLLVLEQKHNTPSRCDSVNSAEEFRVGLKELGLELSHHDCHAVFAVVCVAALCDARAGYSLHAVSWEQEALKEHKQVRLDETYQQTVSSVRRRGESLTSLSTCLANTNLMMKAVYVQISGSVRTAEVGIDTGCASGYGPSTTTSKTKFVDLAIQFDRKRLQSRRVPSLKEVHITGEVTSPLPLSYHTVHTITLLFSSFPSPVCSAPLFCLPRLIVSQLMERELKDITTDGVSLDIQREARNQNKKPVFEAAAAEEGKANFKSKRRQQQQQQTIDERGSWYNEPSLSETRRDAEMLRTKRKLDGSQPTDEEEEEEEEEEEGEIEPELSFQPRPLTPDLPWHTRHHEPASASAVVQIAGNKAAAGEEQSGTGYRPDSSRTRVSAAALDCSLRDLCLQKRREVMERVLLDRSSSSQSLTSALRFLHHEKGCKGEVLHQR